MLRICACGLPLLLLLVVCDVGQSCQEPSQRDTEQDGQDDDLLLLVVSHVNGCSFVSGFALICC